MPKSPSTGGLEISVNMTPGETVAAYITLLGGLVHRTEEVVPDTVMIDYDAEGGIVGIEILRPVANGD